MTSPFTTSPETYAKISQSLIETGKIPVNCRRQIDTITVVNDILPQIVRDQPWEDAEYFINVNRNKIFLNYMDGYFDRCLGDHPKASVVKELLESRSFKSDFEHLVALCSHKSVIQEDEGIFISDRHFQNILICATLIGYPLVTQIMASRFPKDCYNDPRSFTQAVVVGLISSMYRNNYRLFDYFWQLYLPIINDYGGRHLAYILLHAVDVADLQTFSLLIQNLPIGWHYYQLTGTNCVEIERTFSVWTKFEIQILTRCLALGKLDKITVCVSALVKDREFIGIRYQNLIIKIVESGLIREAVVLIYSYRPSKKDLIHLWNVLENIPGTEEVIEALMINYVLSD